MRDLRTTRPSLGARLGWAALACLLAWGAPGARVLASPDARSQLGKAREQLAALEDRMVAAEERVATEQAALRRVLGSLSSEEASYQDVEVRLTDLRDNLAMARDRYARATEQLDRRAAAAYMQGPFGGVEGILSATSIADLSDRVQFVSAIAEHDSELADAAGLLRAELGRRVSAQSRLLERRASLVLRLDDRRQLLDSTFADEQDALAQVERARSRVLALVRKLRDRLTAQEVSAASMGPGTGMPITYGQWAEKFLPAISAPVSQNDLVVMVAWQSAEGTMASWNPLATTYDMPGATDFNSVGVKNYTSVDSGIQAVVHTLENPGHGYEAIVSGLQADADPMVTAGAINASDWCSGCSGGQYVVELIPTVEQYFAKFSSR